MRDRQAPNSFAPEPESLIALGRGLLSRGEPADALTAFRQAADLAPSHGALWRDVGDALRSLGRVEEASDAYRQHVTHAVNDAALLSAAHAMTGGRLDEAERRLRSILAEHPTDLAALRMLAELSTRVGRFGEVEQLLERCLALSPGFVPALHNLAIVLHRQMRSEEALVHTDALIQTDPNDLGLKNLRSAILSQMGRYEDAISTYAEVLSQAPDQAKVWMSYGHLLKTVGRTEDCISAYRRSIELMPTLGEAYWSLANLKTFSFSNEDRTSIEALLGHERLGEDERFHLEFTLGKLFEDSGDYERSFEYYRAGNARRRRRLGYDAAATTAHVHRSVAFLTPEVLARRRDHGESAGDPIFVLGLPRSGSTLVEQILASHSQVEGTIELPDIGQIAREITRSAQEQGLQYPDYIAALPDRALRDFGAQYLRTTRIHRRLGRPFFIDKMPNNWLHMALIMSILPNARIVDARRYPLGTGFSCFKQHFARGQGFSYDLADIGLFYRDYVYLMQHVDKVAPGRVHRVQYEELVTDPEDQIGELLAYCGLPFEEGCLQFHANKRAVRTASAEQVRQPIYQSATEHWRHYEPWLQPLRAALEPA